LLLHQKFYDGRSPEKQKLGQYFFCQKLAIISRFLRKFMFIIFILNFVNFGVDIFHMTTYVTLVSVNVFNLKCFAPQHQEM